MRVWQAPPTWHEALAFSPVGGGLALALLLGGASPRTLACAAAPLGWREAAAIFLLPYLFTSLFLLSSAHLLADLGRASASARWFGWYGEATFGRIVLLFLFNEIVIVGGGWLMDGRWTRSWRLRGLLLLARVVRQPHAADRELRLRRDRGRAAAPCCRSWLVPAIAAVALAGLWAQTFLLTGVTLDAIRGRRPTYDACVRPLARGCDQGRHLQLRLHAAGAVSPRCCQTPRGMAAGLGCRRLWRRSLAGTLLYPLARTIIESFDGSAPFFRPPARQCRPSRSAMPAGCVVGCGHRRSAICWSTCRAASPASRFLFGAAVGALAYAGIDLLRDLRAIRAGRASAPADLAALRPGRLLGGIVGGAIAWYLDAAQVGVIAAKLAAYATVHAPAPDYIIYPLFSKWGALEPRAGRRRRAPALQRIALRRDQLVAGGAAVQHQPRAADRTAAAQHAARSAACSARTGVVGLVEQAIRVLRWGLWMAPVIYSFLRMAPDPTWYNQDGADPDRRSPPSEPGGWPRTPSAPGACSCSWACWPTTGFGC